MALRTSVRHLRNSFRGSARSAALLAICASAACEIPTAPPVLDTRWVVPAEETRFGVGDLLPGEVTIPADSSAFLVDFDPINFSATLAELCVACAAADGLTVPKPAFIGIVDSEIGLPDEVTAVVIESGVVEIDVFNGFNFDPIRPGAGVFGTVELTIVDAADGDIIGTAEVDGVGTPFAPGSTLSVDVPLQAVSVEGAFEARITLNSPAGDPVTVDADAGLSIDAAATDTRVTQVDVDVSGEAVTLDEVSLDLEDVGEEIRDRVLSGALIVEVSNPFAIGGDFQIQLDGPTISPIQKAIVIGPEAESEIDISFTQEEIQSVLGSPNVVLSGEATIDAGAGVITVTPGQELVVQTWIDFELRIGNVGNGS